MKPSNQTESRSAHIIVLGNEKGGSGKSTLAMHVIVALLRDGYKVGSLDLDARQGTLTRYLKNRFDYIARTTRALPSPYHMAIDKSTASTLEKQRQEECHFLRLALMELKEFCDFIVIDTPGTDSHLSRVGHALADTLVTPMNDSLLDFDLLAHLNTDHNRIDRASFYTKTIQALRIAKQERGDGTIDWVVIRNRLSHMKSHNQKTIGDFLDQAAQSYNFRVSSGLSDRVIFKELFLKGMTLSDLEDEPEELTLSQVAARQEVRHLMNALDINNMKYRPQSSPVVLEDTSILSSVS